MLLRNWLDDLFHYAPSGASAEAATDDEAADDFKTEEGSSPKGEKSDKVDAKSEDDHEDEEDGEDEDEDLVDEAEEEEVRSLKDYGLPEDPEELVRQITQLRQQAARADQMQALYFQQQQFLAQQQAAQQKPADAPAKPKLPWEIPEFDPRAKQFLTVDENGSVVVKPGGDPLLPQKYQEWLDARDQALNKFLTDPYGALQDGFAPIIEERAKAIVNEVLQQQAVQQWEQRQQAELAAYDQQFHALYYDAAGQLNQLGQVWNQHYTVARQHGLPDPIAHAHERAMAWEAQQHVANAPPVKEKTKAEKQAEQKLDLLKRGASRTKNRGGVQGKAGRTVAATNGADPWNRLNDVFRAMPDAAFEKI